MTTKRILCFFLITLTCIATGCKDDSQPSDEPNTVKPQSITTNMDTTSANKCIEKQIVDMEIWEPDSISNAIGYGNCQWLYPFDKPQEKLLQQPSYKSENLVYYTVCYGDAEDNIHTIVLDESGGTGQGYDLLYVDVNNDNQIDEKKEQWTLELGTTRQAVPIRIKLLISAGGKIVPYYFSFTAFPYTDEKHPEKKIHANARDSSCYTGEALFDDQRCKIAIADLNSNGLFNDPEQELFRGDRFFVDLNSDGKFNSNDEKYPYGKYTLIKNKWYSITASPEGAQIEIIPASPKMGTVAAPDQMKSALLRSPWQTQQLDFVNGKASAIAGTYDLREVILSSEDTTGQTWECRGSFPSSVSQVTIAESKETTLSTVLPLEVEICPLKDTEPNIVKLQLNITGMDGSSYRCPAPTRERPKSGFEIQDAQGKIVFTADFEYG